MPSPKTPSEYKKKTLKNVFPSDWKNPKPADIYDLIVIGGGPGGMTAASIAVAQGAKVAIVEKEHMGGECFNVGCIPSKALLRSSRLAREVDEAGELGLEIPKSWKVNFVSVMERVRRLQSELSPLDSAEHLKKLGIDVFLGEAKFTGRDKIEVLGSKLKFKKAIISTGTYPAIPDIVGLEEAGYITNQNVFDLTALPKRLVVLGGGPIGCELSQAFHRFGSDVTLITRGKKVLPRDDKTASERLQKTMEKEGMKLIFGTQIKSVEKRKNEKVLHLPGNKKIVVDEILIAIGRLPQVKGLNLEKAGVIYDVKGGIAVSDTLQTSNPNVYASGDVASPYKFTHISMELAGMAVQNALNDAHLKRSSLTIPWCTYTDPEVAHIGMHESDAISKGIALKTHLVEMKNTARAVLDGETIGFVKIHVKEGTEEIVGATIMARHAGDMISEIAVAMASGKGISALSHAIHPFPTQAEAVRSTAKVLETAKAKKSLPRKRAA